MALNVHGSLDGLRLHSPVHLLHTPMWPDEMIVWFRRAPLGPLTEDPLDIIIPESFDWFPCFADGAIKLPWVSGETAEYGLWCSVCHLALVSGWRGHGNPHNRAALAESPSRSDNFLSRSEAKAWSRAGFVAHVRDEHPQANIKG